jgi:hypothetical protein
MSRAVVVAGLWIVATTPVIAQDVQRCEAADGKVTYANGPCPSGTRAVRTLPPADTPSAANQQAAQQRAKQDAGRVAAIERDKKAEETRIAREQERVDIETRKLAAQCRRLESGLQQAQDELAGAPSNKRAEAQRRVKRAEALYTADCVAKAK